VQREAECPNIYFNIVGLGELFVIIIFNMSFEIIVLVALVLAIAFFFRKRAEAA
jgi:hypothetical protein